MIVNHKVVAIVPVGRECTLRLLLPHLLSQRELIDECHLWINTRRLCDLRFISQVLEVFPEFFLRVDCKGVPDTGTSLACAYGSRYRVKNAVFLRIDDGIVWLHEEAIRRLLEFRVLNRQYFLTIANVWNNQLCDHLHQRCGLLPNLPFIQWQVFGGLWGSGEMAEAVHSTLLRLLNEPTSLNALSSFERWELNPTERCSINLASWLGEDLALLSPDGLDAPFPGGDEEEYLTQRAPTILGKRNVIVGRSLACHYSFPPQRDFLASTDILRQWSAHIPENGHVFPGV